jgi:ATP-binding cassette subfamily C protein LapB
MTVRALPLKAPMGDTTLSEPSEPKRSSDVQGPTLSSVGVRSFHEKLRLTVWQHGEGDTAFAKCLCALLMQFEPTIEFAKVVDSIPRRSGRFDAIDLVNTMANFGYDSRKLRLRARDIDPRLLPCLFVIGDPTSESSQVNVILGKEKAGSGSTLTVFEGNESQSRQFDDQDPMVRTVGTAYVYQKSKVDEDAVAPVNPRFTEPSWFRQTLSRFSSLLWWLFLIGAVTNCVSLATPIFVMLVYDRVISPQTFDPLTMLVIGVGGAILIEARLRGLRTKTLAWLTARLDYVIGVSIFERLLLLAPLFVERADVAAQVARVKTFESVRDFFSGPVFLAVTELPTVFIALAVIAYLTGFLVFVPIMIAMLYLVVFMAVRQQVAIAILDAAKKSSATQQFAIETLEKLEALCANGLQNIWADKFQQLSGREQIALARLYYLGSIGETLGHALSVVAAIAMLWFGVEMIWNGSITTGALIAAMILVWHAIMPFYNLCQMIPRFEQTRNSIGQINELMELKPEAKTSTASVRLPKIEGAISFRNVVLRYARDAGPVIVGLSGDFQPGEVVAISGASGSGKSSLLKLVKGLYPCQGGAIFVDGVDIRQLVARDLRRFIAYLPQQPDLFSGTLADNLRAVMPLASDQELWAALQKVGATRQVAMLPRSINTRVEDCEQMQSDPILPYRIALARVFLQNSTILLLDEVPNALLGAGLAETISDLIREVRGVRTLFFVTHRSDLVRLADKQITLRRGTIPTIIDLRANGKQVA